MKPRHAREHPWRTLPTIYDLPSGGSRVSTLLWSGAVRDDMTLFCFSAFFLFFPQTWEAEETRILNCLLVSLCTSGFRCMIVRPVTDSVKPWRIFDRDRPPLSTVHYFTEGVSQFCGVINGSRDADMRRGAALCLCFALPRFIEFLSVKLSRCSDSS